MKRGVLSGPLKDDRVFALKYQERITTMRPLKSRVLVELVFDITSNLLYIPKQMERTTMSRILTVGEETPDLTQGDIVLHGNRAGFQFSFLNDQKSKKYRIIPYRMIQAIVRK